MLQARKAVWIIILIVISLFFVAEVNALEIKEIFAGVVDEVVDGDTFRVTVKNGTQYSVRLADLNAEELSQAGYQEAKDLLDSLVYGKTVYLDVDDVYLWDYHGTGDRLVCVVYVEHNTTHLLNVNKALIDSGKVRTIDYENEFSPYTWSLYVSKEIIPEFPACLIPIYATVGIIVAAVLFRLRRMRPEGRFESRE